MNLKDYVFVLGEYHCDKHCPYCIAKMNKKETLSFERELEILQKKLEEFKEKNIKIKNFILSGNGEPSLYKYDELKMIRDIVMSANVFEDYRIQTSGNLFMDKEKLSLFDSWLKEITVITSNPKEDQEFYNYKKNYLSSKSFLSSNRIRVNIVVLKSNLDKLNKMIDFYDNLDNVETIALKILDNSLNNSEESNWISNNAIRYEDINKIIKVINEDYKFLNFINKRFIYETKNKKKLTIHYSESNTYDVFNLNKEYSFHNRKIKKGIYGEFSKIEEELDEAKEALEQGNKLMFLIELSDIIGAIEGVTEHHGLDLNDLIKFSNKVKESKTYE